MKTAKRLLLVVLMSCCVSVLTGCRHVPVVLDPNRDAQRMEAGQPFTPPGPGYFVPDALMLEVMDKVGDRDVFGTP